VKENHSSSKGEKKEQVKSALTIDWDREVGMLGSAISVRMDEFESRTPFAFLSWNSHYKMSSRITQAYKMQNHVFEISVAYRNNMQI
jgi:hypothetical protein